MPNPIDHLMYYYTQLLLPPWDPVAFYGACVLIAGVMVASGGRRVR